ncbi:MAG: vitamin K epoxide reductase family protein [Candidatus Yonathbacteria bacterium]|nr:vitamin K epoxide reductase family protein [Candidatus Yonathbacteria bacterium]
MQSRTLSYILWAIIALALIGFTDSAFLLAKRVSGAPIPCFITSGCDTVSKSPYSVLFGIPLSLLGVIFYLSIGFLALLYMDTKNILVGKLITIATTLGFLSSAHFIYIQKFKIGTFCIYCILSAVVSTVLFGLGIMVYKKLASLDKKVSIRKEKISLKIGL